MLKNLLATALGKESAAIQVDLGHNNRPQLSPELTEAANSKLAALMDEAEQEQLQATLHCTNGVAYKEIVEYANQKGIDLIVMGTHGRGPLAQALLGGVVDKVLRKAPCPVVTVRPNETA